MKEPSDSAVPVSRNPMPIGFPFDAGQEQWDGIERRAKPRPKVPPMPHHTVEKPFKTKNR